MNNHSNNLKQPQSRLSRHDHNLSAGYSSTMSTGMIIPQYFHILQPGDSFYAKTKSFARLKDIVTAFLGEVEMHYDWFFVPLQMLYTPFGQIFAQTNDFVSVFFAPNQDTKGTMDAFPRLNIKQCLSTAQSSAVTAFGEALGISTTRLMDALNAGSLAVVNQMPNSDMGDYLLYDSDYSLCPAVVSPFAFAAYQCIYQKFYRNEQYEKLAIHSYNFDTAFGSNTFTDFSYLTLRYHQRLSDYFTSVRPSPLYSAVNSVVNSSFDTPNNFLGGFDPYVSNSQSWINGSVENLNNIGQTSFDRFLGDPADEDELVSTGAFNSDLNASNIRQLFAVDKFLRVYGRAGKTYDDQILAHFGVKVPHDVKHDLTHIKHYSYVLTSDPVYSTSQNDDVLLGQVGGQSQAGLDADQFKFTAPVHGVIMCCAYALVRPRYQFTFDKLHRLFRRIDFPIPEFDKLGAQPLFAYEGNPRNLFNQGVYELSNRFGWQNRYNEFKQKYNRISLAYYHAENVNGVGVADNPFSSWVLSRTPFGFITDDADVQDTFDTRVLMGKLYESPYALNTIMSVPYDGRWSNEFYVKPYLMFATDPIILETYVKAKLVSWMSETGEPDL